MLAKPVSLPRPSRTSDIWLSACLTPLGSPRPDDVDARDYHFVQQSEFDRLIASHALFEHAKVFGNFYGTSKQAVEAQLAAGVDVILEIDWQGAAQVLQHGARGGLYFYSSTHSPSSFGNV